ncbi:MAG: hypothetical protein KDA22_16050, partial [Phycisphaerales bacterium]|nr:hypothetical protein [Phycisphaerales bacterium]
RADPGRVLVLTASVGAGHTRAAEAVASGLQSVAASRGGAVESIEVVDVLAHATPWFRNAYRGLYLGLIDRAPAVVGWLYDRSDRPWTGVAKRWHLAHANLSRLRRLLAERKPDLVVCTHFLASEYLAGLRRRGRLSAALATVVTDIDVHGMWFCAPCDHYFVAADESAQMLLRGGVPPERITTTGIPIDPVFAEPLPRSAACGQHGLDPQRRVVLFTTGGCCIGPVVSLFESLLRLDTPAELVTVCGRNETVRTALEAAAQGVADGAAVRPHVLGFTTRMNELMAAADLLVGKPGGLTSSEARARGLPMVILHAVPGQEERNADHLLEWGCAIRCNTSATTAWRIDRLLADGSALDRMRRAATASATPRSALDCAARLLDLFAAPCSRASRTRAS